MGLYNRSNGFVQGELMLHDIISNIFVDNDFDNNIHL